MKLSHYADAINSHDDITKDDYYAAQGIHYAISSARVSGITAIAFTRRMTADQINDVIQRMVTEGINTMDRVPRWLNEHYQEWETIVA